MTKKEEQFKSIYQQYKDQIYRFCLGFVGETSEADILFQVDDQITFHQGRTTL